VSAPAADKHTRPPSNNDDDTEESPSKRARVDYETASHPSSTSPSSFNVSFVSDTSSSGGCAGESNEESSDNVDEVGIVCENSVLSASFSSAANVSCQTNTGETHETQVEVQGESSDGIEKDCEDASSNSDELEFSVDEGRIAVASGNGAATTGASGSLDCENWWCREHCFCNRSNKDGVAGENIDDRLPMDSPTMEPARHDEDGVAGENIDDRMPMDSPTMEPASENIDDRMPMDSPTMAPARHDEDGVAGENIDGRLPMDSPTMEPARHDEDGVAGENIDDRIPTDSPTMKPASENIDGRMPMDSPTMAPARHDEDGVAGENIDDRISSFLPSFFEIFVHPSFLPLNILPPSLPKVHQPPQGIPASTKTRTWPSRARSKTMTPRRFRPSRPTKIGACSVPTTPWTRPRAVMTWT
jgi:hypothetical protein